MLNHGGNLLIKKSVDLVNTRNSLIGGSDDKKCFPLVHETLETPFSIKVPLTAVEVSEESIVTNWINEGVKQLVILHGFTDFSEEAINSLQKYATAQWDRLSLQYKISESRRKERMATAFKSSAQHVLCNNHITEPVMLQKYVHRKVYPHCMEIAQWWSKYIKSVEDRPKLLKELAEGGDVADKKQPDEPKKGKKRKRIGEMIIVHAVSPPSNPAAPPWKSKKKADVVTLRDSESESSSIPSEMIVEIKNIEEKPTSSAVAEEKVTEEAIAAEEQVKLTRKYSAKPQSSVKKVKKIPEEFWEKMENAVENPVATQPPKPKAKRGRPRKK